MVRIPYLFFGLIVVLFFGWRFYETQNALFDPDEKFLLTISKQMAGGELPKAIAEFPHLRWQETFENNMFGFFAVGAIGYRLADEQGAKLSVYAFTVSIFLLVFFFVYRRVGFFSSAAIFLAFVCTSYAVLSRIALFRAHVLGVFFLTLLVYALVERKKWLAALASYFFLLSYHSFYLVLGVLAVFIGVDLITKQNQGKLVRYALVGLALGFFVNPYFPASITGMFAVLEYLFVKTSIPPSFVGNELLNISSARFASVFWQAFVILAVVFFSFFYIRLKGVNYLQSKRYFNLLFTFVCSLGLWCLAMIVPRAAVFAFPPSLFALGLALQYMRNHQTVFLVSALGLFCLQIPSMNLFYFKQNRTIKGFTDTQIALNSIPESEETLFHCNWSRGAYLHYLRPKMKIIDVLDPSLLYRADRQKFLDRYLLYKGSSFFPYHTVHDLFGATYSICETVAGVNRLERDPFFVRVAPKSNDVFFAQSTEKFSAAEFVYKADNYPARYFIPEFVLLDAHEQPASEGKKIISTARNFLRIPSQFFLSDSCILLSPADEMAARLLGRSILAVGSSAKFRVFRNGQEVLTSTGFPRKFENIEALLEFESPWTNKDKLVFELCNTSDNQKLADAHVSLSLAAFTEDSLFGVCSNKAEVVTKERVPPFRFQYDRAKRITCLGELQRVRNAN